MSTLSALLSMWFAVQAGGETLRKTPPAKDIRLAAPVRLKADDAFIDVGKQIAHAGPAFLDFDRDGKRDLVVGTFSGNFALFANAGSVAEPRFVGRGFLQAEVAEVRIHNW